MMEQRALGPLPVSVLSLGSWQTYERIPRADGVAVLDAARDVGITLLEVARYNAASPDAPLATGYSEVVFGEIFRTSGWPRDEVAIANKLWWEFWPEQSVTQELEASLQRTGLDHFDFIYSDPPPAELAIEEVCEAVGGLVTAGKVKGWGVVNWPAERIAEARAVATVPPVAAQLPYNLIFRGMVEAPEMVEAMGPMGVVASAVLAGGALTGKYADGGFGRLSGRLDDPRFAAALAEAEQLRERAAELGTTPAALAIRFAAEAPRVATVLLGATSPEQVRENARAIAL
ncbi:aryl-alcohol dehydrogenase-like predicted oxidoreductase [Solirubrobacter pauli]|uniref:Aryl-alcohol dehydrogenase-like predicted oxidoreductase n=2 Tax=Solirubrobacter pauli TaxID=166793 RepID=A0A660L6F9_9ACTN|nr:aryl-alcohol dehydrogenase-like predicted oxidoreductase [Solirubrobacter pauli]